jgi:hypothetical protein
MHGLIVQPNNVLQARTKTQPDDRRMFFWPIVVVVGNSGTRNVLDEVDNASVKIVSVENQTNIRKELLWMFPKVLLKFGNLPSGVTKCRIFISVSTQPESSLRVIATNLRSGVIVSDYLKDLSFPVLEFTNIRELEFEISLEFTGTFPSNFNDYLLGRASLTLCTELEKEFSFFELPQGFVDLLSFSVGANVEVDGMVHMFQGVSIDSLVALKSDALVQLRKWNNRTMKLTANDHFYNYSSLVVPPCETTNRLLHRLQDIISTRCIRGIRLIELIHYLRYDTGVEMAVYIVGGAVRDLLRNTESEPNDIDLAVSCEYTTLARHLKDFFSKNGKPLDESSLRVSGTCRQFGMMKVMRSDGDHDDLDIGVFKCALSPILDLKVVDGVERTKEDFRNAYLYGSAASLVRDCLFRDYSFNAIYVDPLEGVVLAPCRNMDAFKLISVPLALVGLDFVTQAEANEIIRLDYGGLFRFWKELMKEGVISDQVTVVSIAQNTSTHIIRFGQPVPENVEEREKFLQDGVLFLTKFAKKLFGGKMQKEIDPTLKLLKAKVSSCGREAVTMFTQLQVLVRHSLSMNPPFLEHVVVSDAKSRHFLSVLSQFAKFNFVLQFGEPSQQRVRVI